MRLFTYMAVVCSVLASPAWAQCVSDPGYGITCASSGPALLPKLSGKLFVADIESVVCSSKNESGYNIIKLAEKVEGVAELAITKSACIEVLRNLNSQCSSVLFAIRFDQSGAVNFVAKQPGGMRVCEM